MPTPAEPPPSPTIDPQRRAKVEAARDGWIRKLIDTSRRNNLLYYRDLKIGTLDLTGADPGSMSRLLMQEEVALSRLLPASLDAKVADAKLREIRGRAQINSEERGIETLFMAVGMASWESPDGERPPEAAILLVPLKVEAHGRGGQGLSLKRAGEIQVNLVLLHVLETEFGVTVTPDELLSVLLGDDEGEVFDTKPVSDKLSLAAHAVPGFRTTERIVVGTFAFQKTAMVRDLRKFGEQMAQHDLISAIAGDSTATQSVRTRRVPVDATELDRTAPDHEFLFLDADSSQQLVIRQALEHQDGTIQGPPGTGKSQTIANLIAEFAARGKRVLFVAEKRAALEVVMERLRNAGLDHLALDLHGAEISRREVMDMLQTSLDRVGSVPPLSYEKTHTRLVERRAKLLEHVRRLHTVCAPTGRTIYDVQGRLLHLGPASLTRARWRGEQLDRLDPQTFERASDLLAEMREHRELFLRCSSSPWNGAELLDGEAVRAANSLIESTASDWPRWLVALQQMCEQAGLAMPATIPQLRAQFQLIQELGDIFDAYRPELFTECQLNDLVRDLAPAALPAIRRTWQFLTNGTYRAALRTARSFREVRKVPAGDLRSEIARALELDERWRPVTTGHTAPRPAPSFPEVNRRWAELEPALREIGSFLRRDDLERIELDTLTQLIERLAKDRTTPMVLPKLSTVERSLDQLGLTEFVEELRQAQPGAEEFVSRLEHAWLSSALDRARENDPELAGFRGRSHDKLVDEFRKLDHERIRIAADRVRRMHAEKAVGAMNDFPDEADLVRRECRKKYRGLPIRKLLSQAPQVLTTLRPCWMASPLSVSHLLPVDRNLFDVVLFDEASQVLPEDAVPTLLRCERAVVAGDRHQLPPTTFFVSGEDLDAEPDDSPTHGFESILDLMSGLFESWSLDWHYRSLDESLISFSNRHIYSNRLVTFPGPGRHEAIKHYLVNQPVAADGQEDSVSAEVMKVVELVIEHAAARPSETLGVIALGIKHQQRIQRALDEALRERPDLDVFFDESRRERFFVKNLERVQGDERDAIILTVGYGKDRSGKLPYRFGPLLYDGGERRLNVAVTRARRRMAVVSSFDHRDMDPSRSRAKGVELLRLYLEFAASGGRHLGDAQAADVSLNEFEQSVSDALTAKGMRLLPQWGASRYRIDLVAQHPTRDGRLVLAIECDGATYHSAQSARDRDRLRQQHLEALGWRFHRIWSTDWFMNAGDEIARAIEAYQAAVEAADREDAAGDDLPPSPPLAPAREPAQAATPSTRSARRPVLMNRDSIEQYSEDELVRLLKWLESDGLLRTNDQLMDLMVEELGFERRGARIVAKVEAAIARHRRI